MPSNAAPSKVAGTKLYTQNVYHCEPTSQAREAKAAEIVEKTGGAILVPPYNDVDVLLGQGTCALELNQQHQQLKPRSSLDLVISPLGGGGLLSGVVTYFSDQPHTRVFGAEPSFQGGDDGKRGLEASPPKRIETVQTATIADGLRTPVGPIPWRIFNSSSHNKMRKLEGIRSVTEEQIKEAMKLLMERMKLFVEPSACVGLAALLYDQEYRSWIASQQGVEEVWDVGVILTGGNTTIEAVKTLFQ